jgi:NAD(P)-dependent dehydrogenase (short-subunit alcohol dehydrogenase family)
VNYRGNAGAANETARAIEEAGGRSLVVQANIASAEDRAQLIAATLEEWGRIDLLVNNAGMAPRQRADILETTEASYDEVMAVNLKGPFFLTQSVAAKMIEMVQQGTLQSPAIINIGSLSAYASSPNRPEYCLSKAGIGMMTALFADRLAVEGINVYEIRPGIIQTDMTSVVKGKYDTLIDDGLTPIKRWGQADDVARAVVAIAEGLFPFSTGEIFNVDGGFHLQRL